MKTLLAIVVALSFIGSVNAQDGLPIAATVRIEKIESKQADHESRIAKLERENAELRAALKPASVQTVSTLKAAAPATGNYGWRNPVGHTHTCTNCGDTWDHSKNPTHVCQFCGVSVYIQDSSPRMVQVRSPENVRPVAYTQPVQQTYTIQSYSSGGCANGQCDTGGYGYQRRGILFRRW